jgi:(E)-4-hydroxy-3-methylbut-2-enyl-diphosphate synthase
MPDHEGYLPYCESLSNYIRRPTREVRVGNLGIGGSNPIRIQSMTTTNTMDTAATVDQSIRMIEAGCELVRITAPSIKDAENLQNIKDELHERGYSTPLIADIHFTPNAAIVAAEIVEKVRINPGNYADRKQFKIIEYTENSYRQELERIREKFAPLVKTCKKHGTAMRIGTNHGSLSDRIMSHFGDTPRGMVESAMEFIQLCRDMNFHDIILSMKASNPIVMVQAYRLLVAFMKQNGMNYPLHLGVTEAGEGEDGRIKSAIGIGTLLNDGLGDTVRVSLTEDPENELPVAKKLVERYNLCDENDVVISEITNVPINPFDYYRRITEKVKNFGDGQVPCVITSIDNMQTISKSALQKIGYSYDSAYDKWTIGDLACDYVYTGDRTIDFDIPGTLNVIINASVWRNQNRHFPLFTIDKFLESDNKSTQVNFILACGNMNWELLPDLVSDPTVVLVLDAEVPQAMTQQRRMVFEMITSSQKTPIVFKRAYDKVDLDQFSLFSATDIGGLLIDGFGDGIWLKGDKLKIEDLNRLSFGILQATRTRITKTEYISCPSCGRTLFDLQKTTAKIREKTSHLKGIKIGIMGCIVNGPGEMADADYGYVGTGTNSITLYRKKDVIRNNLPSEEAVDALIDLIKENGDWIDP